MVEGDFLTIIHIAAEVEGDSQRCSRCGSVLIDSSYSVFMGGFPMRAWDPDSFVGSVGTFRDGSIRLIMSVLMDHDAVEADEIACSSPGAGGVQ